MAITATPDPEENKAYYDDGEYDYALIADFFAILHAHFAPQMVDGGDTDRLQVSVIKGRNSLLIRLDRYQQTMKSASEFVIEGENENDVEFRQTFPFAVESGETKAEATTRWIVEVREAIINAIQVLRLPISIPPEFAPVPSTQTPLSTVPEAWKAD